MNPRGATALYNLRSLLIALLVVLAGCATPDGRRDLAPPVQIPQRTWQLVDGAIAAASVAAAEPARNYAQGLMTSWKERVRQRTETDFIPWFSGYWTQQWLAIRVAWYKLGSGEGDDPASRRLAAYLQQQYHDRVLAPVAREIDPEVVRAQASGLYVRLLGEQLPGIARRYAVPQDQFDRRLRKIPAIALSPPPAHDASLYQLVHADPPASQPAYAALLERIREDGTGPGGPAEARLSPVARQLSEKLIARLAASSGASAAAAAVGGVAGLAISLGAAGVGLITHHNQRPAMEAQLGQTLDTALDERWLELMNDPEHGVMAAVHYLSTRIEDHLDAPGSETRSAPIRLEPAPQQLPLADERAVADQEGDD